MDEAKIVEVLVRTFGWSEGAAKLGIRADFRCEYCDRDLLASVDDYDSWQNDHIVPVSKGGTDDHDNMAVACKTCNFIKRNWTPKEEGVEGQRDGMVREARAMIQQKRAKKLAEVSQIRCLVQGLPMPQDCGEPSN
jgi:CRISPR/Cas system Type II protein with McrA/HNH and RuvC-like nuclease domain